MSVSRRQLDWDEGGASERTVLAWERTAIASAAVMAFVIRAGIKDHALWLAIPIAVMLVIAAGVELLFSRRIYSEHDRPLEHGAVLHDRAVFGLAAVTFIAAAGCTALAIAS